MTSVKSQWPTGPSADSGLARPASGYFSDPQYLQPVLASHSPTISPQVAQLPQLPLRSPYTDSQNFMPTKQQALHEDGTIVDETLLNTRANASIPPPPGAGIPTGGSPFLAAPVDSGTNDTVATMTSLNVAHGAGAGAGAGRFAESWDTSQRGGSVVDNEGSISGGDGASIQLANRTNTLRKKASLRRSSSLHRSGSRRSMKAGSVRSLALQSHSDQELSHSAFFCPVPTRGSPTDVLANRFQAWRKILKDLIAYHREIQNHYEQRAKSVQRLSTTLNGFSLPAGFMVHGGLDDASQVLHSFHKQSAQEATKAREIEEDVILALTGLRSDLSQKIKEIKSISGDFRNNVDKEMEATKRAVKSLQDALGQTELDASLTTGRQDPYLQRLAADHQLERQLQEENYLHQAFLNLERSGRELESIVVGEIQKSYNAYAGILKREATAAWSAVEELRTGAIAMPKDQEWTSFIRTSDQLIDPEIPIREFQFIHYPGQDHYACQEIRAGLLERKSKYLKSYTAGWYVLSPTHLHEFKSADKMQAPVMSLYLPEQKLGSHSAPGASSSKFVLKGRQSGGLHRGHTWVFRAESYDTMMAWYEDIHALTEKTPQERQDYARGHLHSRSTSRASQRTFSSDGVNEEDDEPFAVNAPAAMAAPVIAADGLSPAVSRGVSPTTVPGTAGPSAQTYLSYQSYQAYPGTQQQQYVQQQQQQQQQHHYQQQPTIPTMSTAPANRRPSPGGRFPSDLQVNAQRGLEVQAAGIPVSPASAEGSGSASPSGHVSGQTSDYEVVAAASALPGNNSPFQPQQEVVGGLQQPYQLQQFQQAQQTYYPTGVVHSQLQLPYQTYIVQPSSTSGTPQQVFQVLQTSGNGSPVVVPVATTGAITPPPAHQGGYDTTLNSGTHLSNDGTAATTGDTTVSNATQQNDTQQNDTQQNDTQQNDTQQNASDVVSMSRSGTETAARVPVPAVDGEGAAGQPDTLVRRESEAVTEDRMHIPGQYPRLSESK